MSNNLKFTPEYIANCRKATGGPWVFSEPREALTEIEWLRAQLAKSQKESDELAEQLSELECKKEKEFDETFKIFKQKDDIIARLQFQLDERDVLIEQLIDAGEFLAESYREQRNLDDEHPSTWRWNILVAKWQSLKGAK